MKGSLASRTAQDVYVGTSCPATQGFDHAVVYVNDALWDLGLYLT